MYSLTSTKVGLVTFARHPYSGSYCLDEACFTGAKRSDERDDGSWRQHIGEDRAEAVSIVFVLDGESEHREWAG